MILVCVYVVALGVVLALVVEHTLAFVARIELPASGKEIPRHEAVVLAPLAVEQLSVVFRHVE